MKAPSPTGYALSRDYHLLLCSRLFLGVFWALQGLGGGKRGTDVRPDFHWEIQLAAKNKCLGALRLVGYPRAALGRHLGPPTFSPSAVHNGVLGWWH